MISILLIDDDETEYHLINQMMQDYYGGAFSLRYARSIKEATVTLKTHAFDIILLDNNLRDGQTAKDNVPALRDIVDSVPLIVISGVIDAAYLKDKTILDVYDVVDKYHLRDKIARGLLSVSDENP